MFSNQRIWLTVMRASWLAVIAAVAACAYWVSPVVIILLVPMTVFGLIAGRVFHRSVAVAEDGAAQAKRHVKELSHYLDEQKRTGHNLQKSEEKFRNAFDHASIGMALVSMSGKVIKTNRSLEKLIGKSGEEMIAQKFITLLPSDEIDLHQRELTKLFYGAVQATQIEQQILHKNGEVMWVLWNASLIPADAHEAGHYVFQFQDITDKKRAEHRLAHDALHDGLTGLPNRMLFVDRLQVAFRRAQRGFNINFAVCYLDFDQFKLVNDSLGHIAGDKLLVEIAGRLKDTLSVSDTIARLGGDEFAILVEEINGPDDVIPTLNRIRQEIARPFDIDGKPVYSTVSIGIAPWARNYERPELLLRDADTALYQAKRSGRDRYKFFSPEMHTTARESLQTETDLRNAVETGQFEAFYQPIVVLEDESLAGFEALIRWNHPTRGLVSPAEFIGLAEESGLIFPIGEWMLKTACKQLSDWQRSHPKAKDMWVSVNVSAKQFIQKDLVTLVFDSLRETGLPPRSLKLELTESAMAENLDYVVEVMVKLKSIGVRLSIDDFGTGYSSLSNLHRLPLNSLKIDRAFVHQMEHSSESDEIIRTIVSLAQSLDLKVIAEGLESHEQLVKLRSLKCQMGQGYYYSRPLAAAAAEAYILDSSARRTTAPFTVFNSPDLEASSA